MHVLFSPVLKMCNVGAVGADIMMALDDVVSSVNTTPERYKTQASAAAVGYYEKLSNDICSLCTCKAVC